MLAVGDQGVCLKPAEAVKMVEATGLREAVVLGHGSKMERTGHQGTLEKALPVGSR